jgi:hypothetical protein
LRTVVVTDDTLFAATGSAVVLETETVLSIWPTVVADTTIFTLTVDAGATEPSAHVTVRSATVHDP